MTTTTSLDYWAILGVSPGSDISQIKTAFRKEARRWHPDLNVNDSNAEERFKLVNEAYAVLSDPNKRSAWEAINFSKPNELFSTGFPSYSEYLEVVLGISSNDISNEYQEDIKYSDEFESNDFEEEDLYSENVKPAPYPSQPPPVLQIDDIETVVSLTPLEALNGTTVEIELNNGTVVEFATPPFSGDGWRLRLPGVVMGGKDHFIQIRVETEEGLRIDGLRVMYRLELFPQDALFGCGVEIPTLDGPVTLQVPPKSSSGRLLRLKGRGLQCNDICGDQIVEIVLVLPADLTDSEVALYRRLHDLAINDI